MVLDLAVRARGLSNCVLNTYALAQQRRPKKVRT